MKHLTLGNDSNYSYEWASNISIRDICENVAHTTYTIPKDKDGNLDVRYMYTNKEEDTLINHLKTGNYSEASAFIDIFYQNRNMFPNYKRYIIYNIANTIIKYLIGINTKSDTLTSFTTTLFKSENMNRFYHKLKQTIAVICERNVPQPGNKLCVRVHSYVEENYLDKNLSVNQIADALNLNYIYLSSSFKKYSGEGLLNYINQIRVAKSKFLLDNLNISIEDVALSVGYSTLKTYVRVFKQIEGISPANYRKYIIKSEFNRHNSALQ